MGPRTGGGRTVVHVTSVALPRHGINDHGMSRVDPDGRIHDKKLWDSLGWVGGLGVRLVLGHDRVRSVPHRPNARRPAMYDDDTVATTVSIDARGRFRIPLAMRRTLHLAPQDLVLLSADPERDLLVLTPGHLLDDMVRGTA